MNYKNLNEINKITGTDLGSMLNDIERFSRFNKQVPKDYCEKCFNQLGRPCEGQCDNCPGCDASGES